MSLKSKDSQVDPLIHSPWFIKTSQPDLIFQGLFKENSVIFKDSFLLETSKIWWPDITDKKDITLKTPLKAGLFHKITSLILLLSN